MGSSPTVRMEVLLAIYIIICVVGAIVAPYPDYKMHKELPDLRLVYLTEGERLYYASKAMPEVQNRRWDD